MSEPGAGAASRWRVVGIASLALGLSAPGQTLVVAVFIEPMAATLGVSRSQASGAYLVATLLGAAAMPFMGRLIDRHGARVMLAATATGFGFAVAGMSQVSGLASLCVGFFGIRMLGQGSLPLVSTTSVAVSFDAKRGLALGVSGAAGAALLSFTPLAFTAMIGTVGWRTSWIVAAVTVWVILLPLARWGLRGTPAASSDRHDDVPGGSAHRPGWTRGQACRTAMFWALTGNVAVVALVGTGLVFHLIAIFGEGSVSRAEAAANFLPQTVVAIATMLLSGSLVDRVGPRLMIWTSMGAMISALLVARAVGPGLPALAFAAAIGVAGGTVRAIEGAVFSRIFGTAHIGAIRGMVFAVAVAASSLGPLIFSVGFDRAGSFRPILAWLVLLPLIPAVMAMLARDPGVTPARPVVEAA